MTVVAVSGGFDPLHSGHINLLQDAFRFGKVLVFLNSDAWLERKKGKPFLPFEERRKILESLWMVNEVAPVDDDDGTVCAALRLYRPDFFANGGDRVRSNTPELDICKELGITPLFGVGGSKSNSSSEVLKKWVENAQSINS